MINKDLYEDLQLTIYKNYSNICFDVSGGADSAILLYFLVNYLDEYNNTANIHLVTCAKHPTGYSNAMQSVKVVNRIIELTSTKLIKSHYTFYTKKALPNNSQHTLTIPHTIHAHNHTANLIK